MYVMMISGSELHDEAQIPLLMPIMMDYNI